MTAGSIERSSRDRVLFDPSECVGDPFIPEIGRSGNS